VIRPRMYTRTVNTNYYVNRGVSSRRVYDRVSDTGCTYSSVDSHAAAAPNRVSREHRKHRYIKRIYNEILHKDRLSMYNNIIFVYQGCVGFFQNIILIIE